MRIIKQVKKNIRAITPPLALQEYHRTRALFAAQKNQFPARRMIIIGITGTKGKTSTANYVWSVLRGGGMQAGLISTANFRMNDTEELNAFHMTMPSPFFIQKKLQEMQRAGIEAVVVEMTSEGMKQFRHLGIPVDMAIFTNLTPEHLTSHKGDFEVYKKAKTPLFKSVNHAEKILNGKKIPRAIIANADSEHGAYYLQFPADHKITFGLEGGDIRATEITAHENGTEFKVDADEYRLSIPGIFNIYNALPAIAVGKLLGFSIEAIQSGIARLQRIPGRMDRIKEGQNFTVIVDYAHEPASLGALLRAARSIRQPGKKIILLTGGQGGGRDPRKRPPMAKLAALETDIVFVTNEDPYEDDPATIVEEITQLVEKEGKIRDINLFAILDRKEAITRAVEAAAEGDIVLITGKGAETTMMVKGGHIPWNEHAIVSDIVRTRNNPTS